MCGAAAWIGSSVEEPDTISSTSCSYLRLLSMVVNSSRGLPSCSQIRSIGRSAGFGWILPPYTPMIFGCGILGSFSLPHKLFITMTFEALHTPGSRVMANEVGNERP